MKILLAIDGSPCSDAALDTIVQRPWPEGSEVRIISVAEPARLPGKEPWVLPRGYFEQLANAAIERLQALVNSSVAHVQKEQGKTLKVTGHVFAEGNPKEVILDHARQWEADLIVVGSHGLHGWQKFWLGSVSQAVAALAQCSVEIVRRRPGTACGEEQNAKYVGHSSIRGK